MTLESASIVIKLESHFQSGSGSALAFQEIAARIRPVLASGIGRDALSLIKRNLRKVPVATAIGSFALHERRVCGVSHLSSGARKREELNRSNSHPALRWLSCYIVTTYKDVAFE